MPACMLLSCCVCFQHSFADSHRPCYWALHVHGHHGLLILISTRAQCCQAVTWLVLVCFTLTLQARQKAFIFITRRCADDVASTVLHTNLLLLSSLVAGVWLPQVSQMEGRLSRAAQSALAGTRS